MWRSSLWRGCGPFVSMADVSGIVGFATWCGTGRLVEPKYHGGAKYHPSRGTFRCLERVASSRRRRPQFLQWWLLGIVHVPSVVASQLPCPVRSGEFCLQCGAWPVRLRGRCVGDRGACHVAWHGVSCRTELPRGCEVLPRPHPQVHVLQRSTCPTRLRHGAGGRLRQGAGGTARRELRAQVLICVACMVRPR